MESSAEMLSVAWDVISKAFRPLPQNLKNLASPDSVPKEVLSSTDFASAISTLHQHGLVHIIKDWFFDVFQDDLRDIIIPHFWGPLKSAKVNSVNSDLKTLLLFPKSVNELHSIMNCYGPTVAQLQSLEEDIPLSDPFNSHFSKRIAMTDVYAILRALLLSEIPLSFQCLVVEFYSKAFKAFHHIKSPENTSQESSTCASCEQDIASCLCNEILEKFYIVNKQMCEMELLESLVGNAVITVAHQCIEDYVQEISKGTFEASYINQLEEWLDKIVISWLKAIYGIIDPESDINKKTVENLKNRLYYFLYKTFVMIRMKQLFDIIIEFPDSQPTLEDLKECLEKTGLRSKLIETLRLSFETRLLHPGVNTSDILTAYISAIKALRVLDSTGVILHLVCEPVRKYLRSREDTIRCIVSSLTDESVSELASELMRGVPLILEESYHSDDESGDWQQWNPDPIDAEPNGMAKSHRSADIISMLVNIYGSKELFVNEYRNLLADRLLSSFCYDTEREIRYLELLKLRFGESQLHLCEVMLKDVADSKRINAHINSGEMPNYEEGDFPVSAMILSAQFWPNFKEEKLKPLPFVESALENYKKAFETMKGNRTLCWRHNLGIVHLELELKDRTQTFSVSPFHATIIWHFQEKSKWTIEELSMATDIPPSVLRRKIMYWQNQGLLKEVTSDTFILVEDQQGKTGQDVVVLDEEEEDDSVMASSHDQQEEELQMFWSFIVGMLTNLETLPLERIHTMLRMFAMQGPNTSEFSIHELRNFLDRKVKEQKLVYSDGLYKLPKLG